MLSEWAPKTVATGRDGRRSELTEVGVFRQVPTLREKLSRNHVPFVCACGFSIIGNPKQSDFQRVTPVAFKLHRAGIPSTQAFGAWVGPKPRDGFRVRFTLSAPPRLEYFRENIFKTAHICYHKKKKESAMQNIAFFFKLCSTSCSCPCNF